MIDWFEKINRFYSRGLWTILMVQDAVIAGVITEAQYTEITGEPYPS